MFQTITCRRQPDKETAAFVTPAEKWLSEKRITGRENANTKENADNLFNDGLRIKLQE
ncbi:MAG: hypothetical protein ACUVRL_05050 [Candidatus Saccharicenans sp.]|uniref:hypothetical protein n=1 Tax=Candidatus Saccharicenans sp. TaxID=2819258 RepID=UPI00404A8B30